MEAFQPPSCTALRYFCPTLRSPLTSFVAPPFDALIIGFAGGPPLSLLSFPPPPGASTLSSASGVSPLSIANAFAQFSSKQLLTAFAAFHTSSPSLLYVKALLNTSRISAANSSCGGASQGTAGSLSDARSRQHAASRGGWQYAFP